MNKEKKTTEKTDFQGPVSLDAIFAATKGIKTPEIKKEDKTAIKVEVTEKEKKDGKPKEPIVTEIIETPAAETVVAPIVDNTEGTEFFKTAQKMISLGLLKDFAIQISEEDKDGTSISEFKEMTEENLAEIIKIHKQEKKNEISSGYISKEGLKEHQLKVIEILKNGGDLSQIAETEEKAFDRPFEGFDMDVQQRQIDVVYTDLTSGKGLDHESSISLIKSKVEKGTLEKEAKKIFDLYRSAHTTYIDNTLKEQLKKKEFKDLNFKENKKTLIAKFKESGLKESVYKKVASEYAKKNANGEYALIDKLKEALNNPEENHELILHLADKNLFNETFKIKSAHETQKTVVRLATGVTAKGNKKSSTVQTTEDIAPWIKIAQMHNENIKN